MDNCNKDATTPTINHPKVPPINAEDYINVHGYLQQHLSPQNLADVEPINLSLTKRSEFEATSQYNCERMIPVRSSRKPKSRGRKTDSSSTKKSKPSSSNMDRPSKPASMREIAFPTTSINSSSPATVNHTGRQTSQNNYNGSSRPFPLQHQGVADVINMPPPPAFYAQQSQPVNNEKYQLLPQRASTTDVRAIEASTNNFNNCYQNYKQDMPPTFKIPSAKRFKLVSNKKNLPHTITSNAMNNLPIPSTTEVKSFEPQSFNYPYNFQTTGTTPTPPSYEYDTSFTNTGIRYELPSTQFKTDLPPSAVLPIDNFSPNFGIDTILRMQGLQGSASQRVPSLRDSINKDRQEVYAGVDYSQSSIHANAKAQQELMLNSSNLLALPPAVPWTIPALHNSMENQNQHVRSNLSLSTHAGSLPLKLPPQKVSTLSAISPSSETQKLQCEQFPTKQLQSELYSTAAPTSLSTALQTEPCHSILQQAPQPLPEQQIPSPIHKSTSQCVSLLSNQLPRESLNATSSRAPLQVGVPQIEPSQYQFSESKPLQPESALTPFKPTQQVLLSTILERKLSKPSSKLLLQLGLRCDPIYLQLLLNCIFILRQNKRLSNLPGTEQPKLFSTLRRFCNHYGIVYPAIPSQICCIEAYKIACPECKFCIEFVRAIMLEMNRSRTTVLGTFEFANAPKDYINVNLVNNVAAVLVYRMLLFSSSFATSNSHHQRWMPEIQERLLGFLMSQNESSHNSGGHTSFLIGILSSHIGFFPLYERLNLNIFGFNIPNKNKKQQKTKTKNRKAVLNQSQNCRMPQHQHLATRATVIQAPIQSKATASGSSENKGVEVRGSVIHEFSENYVETEEAGTNSTKYKKKRSKKEEK